MKRSALMGAGVPLFGSLLTACTGIGENTTVTPPPEIMGPTPTPQRLEIPTTDTSVEALQTPNETTPGGATFAPGTATVRSNPTAAADATKDAEAGDDDEPQQGGILVALGHHEIASLSPDDWEPAVHYFIAGNIHESLLRLDPWFVLQPALCHSVDISDDGLTYMFQLRRDLTFHEGESFTAADVKYTFDFRRDPENSSVTFGDFASIETIDTPDPYTVIVRLTTPNAAFLTRAGQAGIVPESYHREIGEDGYKESPNGLGPFKLVEWRPDAFAECEAFEDYWAGRPYLDGIRENIVPDASVRAIALETGEADTSIWTLSPEDNLAFRDSEDFTTFTTSSVAVNHFPLDNQHQILSSKAVRQAMMHAIDRDSIITNLWLGLAVKATANLSPAIEFYYEPDVRQYDFDPEAAVQLLEGDGWVTGRRGIRQKEDLPCAFTCTIITGDELRRLEAELVQQYLAQVGIEMTIEEASLESIQSGLRDGTIDMSLYNWTYGGESGEPDASATLHSGGPNNWSRWENKRVDELLGLGLAEVDTHARKRIYGEIQQIVAEEVPFLFIKFWDRFTIFSPRVKGLPEEPLTADAVYQTAATFWIDE